MADLSASFSTQRRKHCRGTNRSLNRRRRKGRLPPRRARPLRRAQGKQVRNLRAVARARLVCNCSATIPRASRSEFRISTSARCLSIRSIPMWACTYSKTAQKSSRHRWTPRLRRRNQSNTARVIPMARRYSCAALCLSAMRQTRAAR